MTESAPAGCLRGALWVYGLCCTENVMYKTALSRFIIKHLQLRKRYGTQMRPCDIITRLFRRDGRRRPCCMEEKGRS